MIKEKQFENIFEQLEYIRPSIEQNKYDVINKIRSKQSCRKNFYGELSLNESLEAAKYGKKDYTEYFLENISDVTNETDAGSGIKMDYIGFAYDMGAVVAGEPECCVNMSDLAPVRTIDIVVDIVFAFHVKANQIMNRGIAITNLISTLLAKKYMVNLMFIDYNRQSDMSSRTITKVDCTNLSIATIAFMCSPEYFRQISWITTDNIRGCDSESNRGKGEISFSDRENFKKKGLFIGGSYNSSATDDGEYDTIKKANSYITRLFNEYCEANNIAA